MYQLAGFDEATAKKGMEVVMDVETRLAKAFRSRTFGKLPIHAFDANYNKMSMEELKKNYPTFDWDAYLSAMGLKDVKEIIVGQPASLKAAADILDTLPIEQQSLYLQWITNDLLS
jgi:putative endopeptidase